MRLEDIIIPQSYIYIEGRGKTRRKALVYAVEIKGWFRHVPVRQQPRAGSVGSTPVEQDMKKVLLRVQLLDENNNVQQVRVIEMSAAEVKLIQDGATILMRTHAKHAPPISLTDWVVEHINGAVDAAGYLDDVPAEECVWR